MLCDIIEWRMESSCTYENLDTRKTVSLYIFLFAFPLDGLGYEKQNVYLI